MICDLENTRDITIVTGGLGGYSKEKVNTEQEKECFYTRSSSTENKYTKTSSKSAKHGQLF